MTEFKVMYDCFLCRQPFQFGPHRYAGEYVRAWDMMICEICISGNWDGIVPMSYPHLHEHLKFRGITIEVNEDGWIDIPRNRIHFTTSRHADFSKSSDAAARSSRRP